MRVLVACEFSDIVRKAFENRGHNAWSCDILPNEKQSEKHIQDDILNHLDENWDLMIAHPPCTYLSNVGIRWFNEERYGDKAKERKLLRLNAMEFVKILYNSNINKICIENPVGYLNNNWRKPDQIVHPCYFGEPENKRTCFWLKNLPILKHGKHVKPKIYGYYKSGKKKRLPFYRHESLSSHINRGHERSRFFKGIAEAMAEQWG